MSWDEKWLERNPFTDEYLQEEVDFYGTPSYDKNGVKIIYRSNKQRPGRMMDYLNENFRIDGPIFPVILIDGKLWMSLTNMEVQSQHIPIAMAEGVVGTCGLGLGHFTLRVAEKESVERIIVFEREKRVIQFFNECFEGRKGFDKIDFVHGDARKECHGYEFDFLYVDIYKTLLPDEVISDISLFTQNNLIAEEASWDGSIEGYHFWGLERVILDSLIGWQIISPYDVPWIYMNFFRQWKSAPFENDDLTMLSDLYQVLAEQEYCEEVLSEMGMPLVEE